MNSLSISRFDREASPLAAYSLALGLALAYSLYLFPASFLLGKGLFFHDGDISTNLSGWLAFAQDDWRWPLLYTRTLNAPEGLSIAFTDSIPIMALLLKPVAAWLPQGWHYFGAWHLVAFGLQSAGAVFLIRSLDCRSLFAALCAGALALLIPVLLFRFGHTALLTQGLLLLALGIYFRAIRQSWSEPTAVLGLAGLCQLALLVHPYLFAMGYAVYAALLLDSGRLHGQWWVQLRRLLLALAVTLVLVVSLGYVGPGLSTHHYGHYGLALNAPWCGGWSSSWLACHPGEGESYGYLGAGVLLLVVSAALVGYRSLAASLKSYSGLVAVCVLLLLFALTHRLHWGNTLLLELPLPQGLHALFSIFQASARFFWPTLYLLTFASLAFWLRKGGAGYALIALAMVLQWMDTDIRRGHIRDNARQAEVMLDERWETALQGMERLELYPAFACGDFPSLAYMPVQYAAAVRGLALNTAYAARSQTDCAAKHRAFEDTELVPGVLYLAPADKPVAQLPALFAAAVGAGKCSSLEVRSILWGQMQDHPMWACRH